MDPSARRTKKRAKKSILGEGQPAGQKTKSAPDMSTSNFTSWRDEEDLVDYEPEKPAAFSPVEDDVLVPEDHTPTLEKGQPIFPLLLTICPPIWRRMPPWRGGNAGKTF
jgi:hypothetical protein